MIIVIIYLSDLISKGYHFSLSKVKEPKEFNAIPKWAFDGLIGLISEGIQKFYWMDYSIMGTQFDD